LNALLPLEPDDMDFITDVHWRSAALVGQALTELRLLDKANEQYAAMIKRAQKWLTKCIEEGHLSPRERAEAGDVLGQLGDPRFDAQRFYLPRWYRGQPEEFMGFVKIPAGEFVMGSRQGDEEAYDNELGNPDRLTLPYDYWLARYPVTVAQYGAFVTAHGYDEERWWTKTGWQWRIGAYDSQVDNDVLRDWLKQRPAELRDRPFEWDDQRRYPNRPVIYVSWFESMAYGAWLSHQLQRDLPEGYLIRLPTEAEWEKAARFLPSPGAGEGSKMSGAVADAGVRYPWGNADWDESRANIDNRHINRVTTVGLYPNGATSTGLHDLSGNVWEWCLSVYQPYPYEPQKNNLNDLEARGVRVLRGGSWFSDARYARCAARLGLDPVYFDDRVGVRVVLSLASSAF